MRKKTVKKKPLKSLKSRKVRTEGRDKAGNGHEPRSADKNSSITSVVSLRKINEILRSTETITQFRDLDAILDNILQQARRLTHCDAGSIYLKEGNHLVFSYVQNDSMFKDDINQNKHLYYHNTMPINENSIAGYVSLSRKPLLLKDVRKLPSSAPYTFNRSFDERTGYRTQSILAVPLSIHEGDLIGVIQLINAQDPSSGMVRPFSNVDKVLTQYFANMASFAIERGKQIREMILRMIKMSELRDPHETGEHVQRVGNYAIEIYEQWAQKKGISKEIRQRYKDTLKIAAMLHDVGKVAISDTILKKPGKLSDEEYNVMKTHTVLGARLFTDRVESMLMRDNFEDLDIWCAEVSLDHHEKWDGSGYPGKIDDLFHEPVTMAAGKQGEEISLTGRIVALADVYDALISKRVYKNSWAEDQVLEYIRGQSGKQFDPNIVSTFFSVYEVIKAIREKYSDEKSPVLSKT